MQELKEIIKENSITIFFVIAFGMAMWFYIDAVRDYNRLYNDIIENSNRITAIENGLNLESGMHQWQN